MPLKTKRSGLSFLKAKANAKLWRDRGMFPKVAETNGVTQQIALIKDPAQKEVDSQVKCQAKCTVHVWRFRAEQMVSDPKQPRCKQNASNRV